MRRLDWGKHECAPHMPHICTWCMWIVSACLVNLYIHNMIQCGANLLSTFIFGYRFVCNVLCTVSVFQCSVNTLWQIPHLTEGSFPPNPNPFSPLTGMVNVTWARVLVYIHYKLRGHTILAVSTKADMHMAQTIWWLILRGSCDITWFRMNFCNHMPVCHTKNVQHNLLIRPPSVNS